MADVPLMNNPMTTAGDVIQGAASGAPARLAVGTAGQVLKVNAGATAVEWAAETGGANVGNMWTMSNAGASQTLTNATDTLVTFDTANIDGGGSVIDLANERFVAPATGFYMVMLHWIWEATAPIDSAYLSSKVGGAFVAPLLRLFAAQPGGSLTGARGHSGSQPLSLTSGDFVTMIINPGVVTGATARGSASSHLRTTFTLVRIT